MPKPGELTYFENIGEEGRQHSINKPFSDPARGTMLMEVGAILSLLPPPPARVLDAGCGTGWLTWILQRSGYEAIGIDVSPHAIQLAQDNPIFCRCEPPRFLAVDVENFTLDAPVDAAVFFGALHHTIDEVAALRCVFRALKPGGICIAVRNRQGTRRHVPRSGGTLRRDGERHASRPDHGGREKCGFHRIPHLPPGRRLGECQLQKKRSEGRFLFFVLASFLPQDTRCGSASPAVVRAARRARFTRVVTEVAQ